MSTPDDVRLRNLLFTLTLGADTLSPDLDDDDLRTVAHAIRRAATSLSELVLPDHVWAPADAHADRPQMCGASAD